MQKCEWHLCQTDTEGRFCGSNCQNKWHVDRRRKALKKMAIAYKGGCCLVCGYNRHVGSLHFHHTEPGQKDFSFSHHGSCRSWPNARRELNKCVLLCANCHGETHAGLDLGPHLHKNPTPQEGDAEIARQGFRLGWMASGRAEQKSCECGKRITRGSTWCRGCSRFHQVFKTKILWPSIEELIKLLETSSYVALGKQLGVSDNAIRKHIARHTVGQRDSNPQSSD